MSLNTFIKMKLMIGNIQSTVLIHLSGLTYLDSHLSGHFHSK